MNTKISTLKPVSVYLLIVVGLVAFFVIGLKPFLSKSSNPSNRNAPIPAVISPHLLTALEIPLPTQIEILDKTKWQRFHNTRYGYTVLYPDGFVTQAYGAPQNEIPSSSYVLFYPVSNVELGASIYIHVNPSTLSGYYDRNCGSLEDCISKTRSDKQIVGVMEDTVILGNKAKKVTTIYESKISASVSIDYYTIIGGNFYNIHFSDGTPVHKDYLPEINKLNSLSETFLENFKISK